VAENEWEIKMAEKYTPWNRMKKSSKPEVAQAADEVFEEKLKQQSTAEKEAADQGKDEIPKRRTPFDDEDDLIIIRRGKK
jgi:hypothetical protein